MKQLNHLLFLAITFSLITFSAGCKKTVDKCESVRCDNSGICNDGNCQCTVGYEGVRCSVKVNEKFNALFSGLLTNMDDLSTTQTVLNLTAAANPTKVSFYFFGDDLQCNVSGNNITIPMQSFDNDLYRYYGDGSINGTQLIIRIHLIELGGNSFYLFDGTKN